MAESVYKVIELVGTSKDSWEKAAAAAVNRASKSLRDLRVAEVVQLDMQLDAKGKIEAYRAKIKVSFKFEGDRFMPHHGAAKARGIVSRCIPRQPGDHHARPCAGHPRLTPRGKLKRTQPSHPNPVFPHPSVSVSPMIFAPMANLASVLIQVWHDLCFERVHDEQTATTATSNTGKPQTAAGHAGWRRPVRRPADDRGRNAASGPPPLFRGLTEGEKARVLEFRKAQGALPRRPAVQPGKPARRHLSDRERADQGVLHRAIGTRDHAGLLAFRQFRRRSGGVQAGPAHLVGSRGRQQHGASSAGRRSAPDGADDPGARHRHH